MGRLVLIAVATGILVAEAMVGRPGKDDGDAPPAPDPVTREDFDALRTELREKEAEADQATRELIREALDEHTEATVEAVQALNERLAHVGRAVEEAGSEPDPPDAGTAEEEEDEPGDDPGAE